MVRRVLLADDEMKICSALRLLLEQASGFEVVGEAADASGLLRAVVEKKPELLLVDWELPGLPAEQLLRLLRYERPLLKIIAMSSRPEAEAMALAADVDAFLSKSEGPDRVLAIIQQTGRQE